MPYHVYILASRRNGTLYIGVTSDLVPRVYQHREGLVQGFSQRYGTKLLVWFESTDAVLVAIARDKQLKNWKREWKLALIEKRNPQWRDLYPEVLGVPTKPLDAGSSPA
ncbi:GIY-YIG nuclease family protein [Ramlibacter sp. MMS24-I3-19]|uniref:GIY-YIG nuclease family protein n=1 Tax=Ramlibacter sp. MMS24-I3-19 TaxID=3416606 RepID=UPI003CFFEC14